jgi:hypothetical protein
VTGLGEFSPIGRLFTLGSFFVKKEQHYTFLGHDFLRKSYILTLTKMCLAPFEADFSANSSGHPARKATLFCFEAG